MQLKDALWPTKSTPPLLVVEHDLSRSPIALLRTLLDDGVGASGTGDKGCSYQRVILASFLHPPAVLIRDQPKAGNGIDENERRQKTQRLQVFDYTDGRFDLEGGSRNDVTALRKEWMKGVDDASAKDPLLFMIDDLDAMAWDVGGRAALTLIQDVIEAVKLRRAPSRTIVAVSSTGRDKGPGREDGILLVEQLLTTSFSPALTHLRLYPPALFTHLSKTFLLPPPPRTPTAKFYGVFAPFVQRERREGERLWHTDLDGADGKTRGNQEETVVEVVVRSPGLRKSVERSLDGWRDGKGTCALQELESLRECFAGSALPVIAGDTKNSTATDPSALELPFNLNLTDEQIAARAKVPLPYAHTGTGGMTTATIYYEPDSADDLDEEDPDDDLV